MQSLIFTSIILLGNQKLEEIPSVKTTRYVIRSFEIFRFSALYRAAKPLSTSNDIQPIQAFNKLLEWQLV
jgi:hypothetical protein